MDSGRSVIKVILESWKAGHCGGREKDEAGLVRDEAGDTIVGGACGVLSYRTEWYSLETMFICCIQLLTVFFFFFSFQNGAEARFEIFLKIKI